jgi:hypothetical protein
MTVSTPNPAQRDAELRLRATTGPLQTHVWWPHSPPPDSTSGLLMFFADETGSVAWLRDLSSRAGFVVVAVPYAVLRTGAPLSNAMTALEWAAEHARELEADPGRLVVGGIGTGAALAAAAALTARDRRWPRIARQVLLGLDLAGSELELLSVSPEGVAPATLVALGAVDEAARYAARLRGSSVGVEEIPYDPDGLVAALARSLT